MAADLWVFITLGLAIAMSVPALHVYMHGTHVVVGHTMGATIGINSMLLMAYVFDVAGKSEWVEKQKKLILAGYNLIQISLVIFFLSLVSAGFVKGFWQLKEEQEAFGEMIQSLRPYFIVFALSGFTLIIGFYMVIFPALKSLFSLLKAKEVKSQSNAELKEVFEEQLEKEFN